MVCSYCGNAAIFSGCGLTDKQLLFLHPVPAVPLTHTRFIKSVSLKTMAQPLPQTVITSTIPFERRNTLPRIQTCLAFPPLTDLVRASQLHARVHGFCQNSQQSRGKFCLESARFGNQFVNLLGESIPSELLQELIVSRYAFQCLNIQNQILYALFDQQLFGPQQPVPTTNGGGTNTLPTQIHPQPCWPNSTTNTQSYTRNTPTGIPGLDNFLISYGAGYYGYIYD